MNIGYPFQFDTNGRSASVGDDDHIRQMIEQFLFTQPGERVNRPDFGAGLLQLVFSPNSPEVAAAYQFSIQAGLQQWLGDVIAVQKLEVTNEDATLSITIQYSIRATGTKRTDTFERAVS